MQPATVDVAELARHALTAPPRLGEVRLVVVDGPAGSGKTTLAGLLAAALGAAPVVHLDDLYEGWTGLGPAVYARLLAQVLDPVAAGGAARFQRYDWDAGRFAEWVEVAPHPVLVVEGVGAAGLPVDPRASLRVWVEAPADLRLSRGVARDGEALREEWVRWAAREAEHFALDGTRSRADVVVDGTAPYG